MKKNLIKSVFYLLVLVIGLPTTTHALVNYESQLSGEELDIGIILRWSTSEEFENKMFAIEKSDDGISYYVIGTLDSKVDSEHNCSYRFLDINAKSPDIFYRLKQVNNDESYSYSESVFIRKSIENNFAVFNISKVATQDELGLTLEAYADGMLTAELTNWKGEVLYKEENILVTGINHLHYSLSDYPAGIYKVKLRMGEEMETITLQRVPTEMEKKANVASLKSLKGN